MFKYGTVKGFEHVDDSTIIHVHIPEKVEQLNRYSDGAVPTVELRIDDGRTITNLQRRKIYATIADISKHIGDIPEAMKEIMKYWHISRTGCAYFSLSDCSITTARQFINTLIEYCLEWSIPLSEEALLRTDDIFAFLAMCYKYKVCCICGRPGQDHHLTAIGMGRDRKQVYREHLDDDNDIIEICAVHHEEAHKIGPDAFCKKYKVFGIQKKYLERG